MPVISPGMEFINKDGIQKEIINIVRYVSHKNDLITEVKTTDEQSEYIMLINDPSYKLCPDCLSVKSIDADQFNPARLKWYIVPADELLWQERTRNILVLLLFFAILFLVYLIFERVKYLKIMTEFENDAP
jgi:hypothetical protein